MEAQTEGEALAIKKKITQKTIKKHDKNIRNNAL